MIPMPRRITRNAFPLTDFDNVFEGFFSSTRATEDEAHPRVPAIDVTEFADRWMIEAELPGVTKQEIAITLKAGKLTLAAGDAASDRESGHSEKDSETAAANGRLVRRERQVRHYARTLSVGRRVDADNICASFVDGVLTLTLPKLNPEVLDRRIEIA